MTEQEAREKAIRHRQHGACCGAPNDLCAKCQALTALLLEVAEVVRREETHLWANGIAAATPGQRDVHAAIAQQVRLRRHDALGAGKGEK